MIRFAFTIPLFLLFIGCQTSGQGSSSTFFARNPRPSISAKQFWGKTTQFFMPDTGKHRADTTSPKLMERFVHNRSHHDEVLPVNHSSHSLYKPGSIFPTPLLALQEPEREVLTVDTETSVLSANSNPLQIQKGDSESFQRLLREIAVVPPSKRNVDESKLTELLVSFREEIKDSDYEEEYIALLRKRILPQETDPSTLATSKAPLPRTEFAEMKRSMRESPMVSDDDVEYELPEPTLKRRLPNKNESVIAQGTIPISAPVYPVLTQLPGAASDVTQAAYQTPHVPYPARTGYGAGDWQTPARQAIEQLRYAIEQTPNGRSMSNEMRLRMLEMLLGNKAEAAKPMQSADKIINEFMGNQVLGFAALMDDTASGDRSRFDVAAYRFNEGLQGLQTLCPLKLKNVMFVKDWIEYGKFLPHPTQEFYPGEECNVYFELENLVVRRTTTADGFEFGVAIRYEVWDSNANVVARQDIGKSAGGTLSRKRDFSLGFPVMLPKNLPPGQYQFRINVTDLNDDAMQYAEEQIPFKVIPSQEGDSYSAGEREVPSPNAVSARKSADTTR